MAVKKTDGPTAISLPLFIYKFNLKNFLNKGKQNAPASFCRRSRGIVLNSPKPDW